jgi:hypothetical protein
VRGELDAVKINFTLYGWGKKIDFQASQTKHKTGLPKVFNKVQS